MTTPRDLSELIRIVGFAGRGAADEWVREREVTRQQAMTIGYIEANQHRGVNAREIAEVSGTTAASVASLLQGLEQRGFITREPSPDDSRVKLLRATPEAVALVDGFQEHMIAAQEFVFSVLDDDERDQLAALLGKLTAHIAEVEGPPGEHPMTRRR